MKLNLTTAPDSWFTISAQPLFLCPLGVPGGSALLLPEHRGAEHVQAPSGAVEGSARHRDRTALLYQQGVVSQHTAGVQQVQIESFSQQNKDTW